MKRKGKVIVSSLLAVLVLVVMVNLPIITYTNHNCKTSYESYMTYEFPCGLFALCVFSSPVKSTTLVSGTLYSGKSATVSSPSTSSFSLGLYNPACNSIYITSLSLWKSNQTMIAQWDNSTGTSSASNLVDFSAGHLHNNLLPPANESSFIYYPTVLSGPAETIGSGQAYNYEINFSNGQSISGEFIAQSA